MSVFPAMSEKEPSTSSRPRPKVSSSIKDIQSAFLAKKEKREGEEEEGEGEKEDQHQHHRRKHHHHHHGKRHAAKSSSAVSSNSVIPTPAPQSAAKDDMRKGLDDSNRRKYDNSNSSSSNSSSAETANTSSGFPMYYSPPMESTQKPSVPAKPPKSASRLGKVPPEVKEKPRRTRQPEGYVGFANLPNQVYRKAVKRGFEFTLMVAGESGLGKSTLINSMFLTDVYSAEHPGPSARITKTVKVDTNKVLLKESGVNLTLTIVDTPGLGDAVDNSGCWDPVIRYVESQYEAFLEAETRVHRVALPDSRVHACLYFIAPSGHGLKPLDIEYMQRLHDKVNIIPVIAKADTLTADEVSHFKRQIMNQIVQSDIRVYEFPDGDGDGDGDGDAADEAERRSMRDRVPFAVVGSNMLIDGEDGKKVRGRRYPWGVVNIENLDHCDFIPLRNMLVRTHLQDLKDVTNDVHYENYRCKKLAGVAGGSVDKIPNRNPLAQIEEERKEHHNKLLKMEREMEEVFDRKVREKQQKLSESKSDLEKRHRESKERLEQQKRELEARAAAFEEEKARWERAHNVSVDALKRLSMESLDGGGGKKKKGGGALSGVSFRMGR